MKCEFCKFAPPVNADGYQDECSLFDLYGTVWKDGKEGCTMSYQTLAKNERMHDEAMADEYIKREDAINTVRNTFTGMTADTLELRINGIPSADVAPVRHGRWIDEEPTVIKCSACGEEFNDEIVYMTCPYNNLRYCPGCGAKMDGGDTDA